MNLIDAITRCCAAPTGPIDPAVARCLRDDATPSAWSDVARALHAHRLLPASARALDRDGLAELVPPAFREVADDAYRRTALTNTLLMHTLARLVTELRRHGVDPVVWKGIVLADGFYPDPGMRWMGDIDLAIEPDEVEPTKAAFAAAGFSAPRGLATPDAIYFESPTGVIVDVHHRVRFFEDHATASITRTVAPRHVPIDELRVLDPDAMIAHLVVHLEGHRRDVGYLLIWILDLAFVLERWGDEIDPDRVRRFMTDVRSRHLWARLLGLLGGVLGRRLPAWASGIAREATPLRLDEVRRRHRLVAWGLPAPRGWLRLGRAGLLGDPDDDRLAPRPADLLLWPVDAWRDRRPAA